MFSLKKAEDFHLKAKENAKILNSLISSLHFQIKKPLNEHKSSTNVKDTKPMKLSFNNGEMSIGIPKTSVTKLRLHLKGKKNQRLGSSNSKSKSTYTNSAITQREDTTSNTFKVSSYKKGSKSLRKNYESNKGKKNYSTNTSASFTETSQVRCLTSRGERLEPTYLGTHEILQPGSTLEFPDYEPAKCSLKSNGIVKAYAVNTNQGIVRYFVLSNRYKGL